MAEEEILKRLRELGKRLEEEEIELPALKRRLPKFKIGEETFTFDREKHLLRNTVTKEITELSAKDVENFDFLLKNIDQVHKDIDDIRNITGKIARRADRFISTERAQETRAKKELSETVLLKNEEEEIKENLRRRKPFERSKRKGLEDLGI
jgi:hypothetical protein